MTHMQNDVLTVVVAESLHSCSERGCTNVCGDFLFRTVQGQQTHSGRFSTLRGSGKSRANARYQPKQSAEKGPHSITSSARARSVGGIVRFRSRAAFRFITSSKVRRLFDREVCWRGPLQDLVYK